MTAMRAAFAKAMGKKLAETGKQPPIMYYMYKTPVILTSFDSAMQMMKRQKLAMYYEEVPLSFFKSEQKYTREQLEKYLADGERPKKAPKDHGQRLKIQVSAAYAKLSQMARAA